MEFYLKICINSQGRLFCLWCANNLCSFYIKIYFLYLVMATWVNPSDFMARSIFINNRINQKSSKRCGCLLGNVVCVSGCWARADIKQPSSCSNPEGKGMRCACQSGCHWLHWPLFQSFNNLKTKAIGNPSKSRTYTFWCELCFLHSVQ